MVDDRVLPDTLAIPVKRWRVLTRTSWSFAVFVLCAAGAVYVPYDTWVTGRHIALVIFGGLFNALFALGAGMIMYADLRVFRLRSLRLDHAGFEFGKHRWAWVDIAEIYESVDASGEDRVVRIEVVYHHPESAVEPGHTPINPLDFKTRREPLADILNRWLDRYGAPRRR